MECPTCGRDVHQEDNYCRACGLSLRAQRLPVPIAERRPVRVRSRPPAVASLVARGVGAVVLGKLAEWAVRQVVGRALSTPLPVLRDGSRAIQSSQQQPQETFPAVIAETRVFWQRVWYAQPPTAPSEPRRKPFWRR